MKVRMNCMSCKHFQECTKSNRIIDVTTSDDNDWWFVLGMEQNFPPYCEYRDVKGEPIPHWRGQMDGCLPFQTEKH